MSDKAKWLNELLIKKGKKLKGKTAFGKVLKGQATKADTINKLLEGL